jgi:hypothetical protein
MVSLKVKSKKLKIRIKKEKSNWLLDTDYYFSVTDAKLLDLVYQVCVHTADCVAEQYSREEHRDCDDYFGHNAVFRIEPDERDCQRADK